MDVAVVGAGPAGSFCAGARARRAPGHPHDPRTREGMRRRRVEGARFAGGSGAWDGGTAGASVRLTAARTPRRGPIEIFSRRGSIRSCSSAAQAGAPRRSSEAVRRRRGVELELDSGDARATVVGGAPAASCVLAGAKPGARRADREALWNRPGRARDRDRVHHAFARATSGVPAGDTHRSIAAPVGGRARLLARAAPAASSCRASRTLRRRSRRRRRWGRLRAGFMTRRTTRSLARGIQHALTRAASPPMR
jgi:hypothetical protein